MQDAMEDEPTFHFPGRVPDAPLDDVVISRDEAGSFLQLNKRWWYPTLEEECYHEEICDWEEVEEAKGNNKQAVRNQKKYDLVSVSLVC